MQALENFVPFRWTSAKGLGQPRLSFSVFGRPFPSQAQDRARNVLGSFKMADNYSLCMSIWIRVDRNRLSSLFPRLQRMQHTDFTSRGEVGILRSWMWSKSAKRGHSPASR